VDWDTDRQVNKTTEFELNICLITKYHASRREMRAIQDTLSQSQRQILIGEISGF
jgi:hypothetical protein